MNARPLNSPRRRFARRHPGRQPHGRRFVLGALALSASFGCASTEPSSATQPAPAFEPSAERDSSRAESFPFGSALRDARDLIDSGEAALAAERLEGALRSNPSQEIRPELLALLREARAADLESRWLSVELTADRAAISVGDLLSVRVRLRSRSDGPIVVPVDAAGAGDAVPPGVALSRTRIELHVAYREIDHMGSVVDAQWESEIGFDEEIRLEPRGGTVLEWTLGTDEPRFRPSRVVVRRVTVSGTFRPVAIVAEGAAAFSPIEFGPLSVDVFPSGYHRFLDDPESRLAEALGAAALDARFLPHVLFGSLFLARRDPDRCAIVLERADRDAPPELAPTIRGCLDLLRRGLLDGMERPGAAGSGSSGKADFPDETGSPEPS